MSAVVRNVRYSYEDFGLDGDGIIAVLTCPNCNATFEGYLDLDNEEAYKQ